MLPLLQSQGLLRDALKCFSIKAQHQEFLAAVGAGLMIQKCMFHGIFEVAEDVRRICEDIVQKLEAWALDGKSGTVTRYVSYKLTMPSCKFSVIDKSHFLYLYITTNENSFFSLSGSQRKLYTF